MSDYQTIKNLLLTETSRRNTDLVVDLVTQKPDLFETLLRIFLSNEEPVSRRAAWVVDIVTENQPHLLPLIVDQIVTNLPSFRHDAMKRHSVRMLNRARLSDVQIGPLINLCFEFLTSPAEAIAVKAQSMDLLYQISQREPELKKELADSIEWRISEESPGFRNKGMKLLKKLRREMNSPPFQHP